MPCSFSDSKLPDVVAALRPRLLPLTADPGGPSLPPAFRQAAVLVALYEGPAGTRFLLTARPETLSRHAGQISLPGGAREATDGTLWDTALRETEEELGLDRDRVHPLGRLPIVQVRASRYSVTPFVGWVANDLSLRPDPSEVAAVIDVPLAALLDPTSIRTDHWDVRGSRRPVTYFLFGEARVWGATARVLGELAERLGASVTDPAPGSVGPAI